MSLSLDDVMQILDALKASAWDQATVTVDDVTIAVSRNGLPLAGPAAVPVLPEAPAAAPVTSPAASPSAPTPPAPAPAPAAPPADAVDGVVVSSPSVGVFWRAPQPGAPPFVEVGTAVQAGDVLCIVEVMKLMNNVVADRAGTIVAIHQDNAAKVEFGTPLVTIAPAG